VAWEFLVSTPAQPVPPAADAIRVNCAPQLLLRRGKDTADSSWTAENGRQCPGQDRLAFVHKLIDAMIVTFIAIYLASR
jgi:hypothetical protein